MKQIIITLFFIILTSPQEIIDFKNFVKSETEDYYIEEWMEKYRALETNYTYLGKGYQERLQEIKKKT